jgi:photosystem II stability/assembly factor-like uncharacterized protein
VAPERVEARSPRLERALVAAVAFAIAIGVAAVWQLGIRESGTSSNAGPVHVHGLGVNPADNALFIATHTGLFRVGESAGKAARVGDSFQDTMGFTVVGEDQFLGSGHPDLRTDLPPLLGLIESTDEGRTWEPISLLGDADFHVLRSAGRRVYGYDSSNDRLLVSEDAGRTWNEAERPAPLVDLAIDPTDERHVLAAGASDLAQGLYESRDSGQSWDRIGDAVGYLAWVSGGRLLLVDGSGGVFSSSDGGRRFDRRGSIGGQPAAFLGRTSEELYVALHDGTIKRSVDGGSTWTVRSTP